MRRIAKQAIPGIPLHFRFGFVQQELPLTEDMVVLDYIMKGVAGAGNLEEQLEKLHSDESEIEALMEVNIYFYLLIESYLKNCIINLLEHHR